MIKVRILKPFSKFVPGQIVTVETINKSNTPTTRFWRRRLHDSEIDNCLEIVTKKQLEQESPAIVDKSQAEYSKSGTKKGRGKS